MCDRGQNGERTLWMGDWPMCESSAHHCYSQSALYPVQYSSHLHETGWDMSIWMYRQSTWPVNQTRWPRVCKWWIDSPLNCSGHVNKYFYSMIRFSLSLSSTLVACWKWKCTFDRTREEEEARQTQWVTLKSSFVAWLTSFTLCNIFLSLSLSLSLSSLLLLLPHFLPVSLVSENATQPFSHLIPPATVIDFHFMHQSSFFSFSLSLPLFSLYQLTITWRCTLYR